MQLVEVNVKNIIPYTNNPRKNEKAVSPVMKSIEQCGYNQPKWAFHRKEKEYLL